MFKKRNKYLQELRSFELDAMPLEIPKGGLVIRLMFVMTVLGVAALLFYFIISTLLQITGTFQPEVIKAYLNLT